jgi:hypothetical protein
MYMNWYILIPFGIAVIALIVFLVKRNQKDEVQLEDQLKNDYPKPKDDEGDITIEEVLK